MNNLLYKILIRYGIIKSQISLIFRKNRKIKNKKIKNLTIISIHGIGNAILTIPLLKSIKKEFPDSKITFLYTNKVAKEIIPTYLIENFIELNPKFGYSLKFFIYLLSIKNDIIFYTYPFKNKTILELTLLLRSKYRIGYNTVYPNYFSHQLELDTNTPEWKLNLNLFTNFITNSSSLNYNNPLIKFEKLDEKIKNLISKNKNILVLHPGAGAKPKQWPIENFIQLIYLIKNKYDFCIVILGGPDESVLGQKINEQCSFTIDLTGKLTIVETAQLISSSKLMISNDSGLMHLAGAVGIPQIAIFGPTPIQKNIPWGNIENKILIKSDCSPCYKNGEFYCRKDKKYSCLKNITPEYVYDKMKTLLS